MKIISWNVNGIRARWSHLIDIIKKIGPDVLLIQETKVSMIDFAEYNKELNDLGYNVELNPNEHSGHHGTAIITKHTALLDYSEIIVPGRVQLIALECGWTIYSAYINQGQSVDSEEYVNKFKTLADLDASIKEHIDYHHPILVGGDFNITPTENDVWSKDHWHEGVIACTPKEREAFKNLLDENSLYLVESCNNIKHTWYPYRHTWRKYKDGMRTEHTGKYGITIDHILTNIISINRAELLEDYRIPVVESQDTTSDHLPIYWSIYE
ncbi:exodeoxyribonuclease III [Ralstonia phage RP13]|nr:exodeoxyribonuclease III [Ralstonia phage RP13]BCG50292.1 exodeoxyribonuclease III [Ralstonia phage RP13]